MNETTETPPEPATQTPAQPTGNGAGGADAAPPADAGAGTADAGAAMAGPNLESEQADRIAALESEVASLKDQSLRALAELENTRRRAQRERDDTAKFAVSGFAKELLAVADNLRRAIDSVPQEHRSDNEVLHNLLVGVEATERQLFAAFDRFGVKKIDAMDQPFDPNYHQVMFELDNTGRAAGTIVQVLQDGYTIQGRLLREAMVGVAKGEAGQEPPRVDTTA